jgi:3-phenylpropionate/trans-cinnamate dioxygenase ferredoxin reductase component
MATNTHRQPDGPASVLELPRVRPARRRSALAARPIVIVGGGQAGLQAAASLREAGFDGPLTLIAAEGMAPYERPPLSKRFLAGAVEPADLALCADAHYGAYGIYLVLGDRVTRIDRQDHYVTLASGRSLPYHRLVLALGASPRRLEAPGAALSGVLSLRTLPDACALRSGLARSSRIVIVGAGLIGLEVAVAARGLGCEVAVVEPSTRVMARTVTADTSTYLAAAHRRRGVRLLLGRRISSLHGDQRGQVDTVRLSDGRSLATDLVLTAIGVDPETRLAEDAGLQVADGIVVDERLRTSDPDIFAIGDCARFPSPFAETTVRLESAQNAVDAARCVAANLLGGYQPYCAVPWFSTEQYAERVQIAGITAGHDAVETTGDPARGSYSSYCFRGERLVGVESVNRPGEHMTARRLLAHGVPVQARDVRRSGFEPHQLLADPMRSAA